MKTRFTRGLILILIILSNVATAQLSITEYKNLRSTSSSFLKRDIDYKMFDKIAEDNQNKMFLSNNINTIHPQVEDGIDEVTLSINLDFDPSIYIAPWIIYIYNESGFLDFAFYEGNNLIETEVPAGEYDIYAEFLGSSYNSVLVIKEQQDINSSTTINLTPSNSINHITFNLKDENNQDLIPGTHNPETDTYSEVILERALFFQPSGVTLGVSSFSTDYPTTPWNFHINDMSDRYAIYNSCIASKFENDNYFFMFDEITEVNESKIIENNPSDLVYHEEKFQPSIIGESGYNFSGFATQTTINYNDVLGGWIFFNLAPIDPNEPINFYIGKYKDDLKYGMMVNPTFADHLVILDPNYGAEPFSIIGNAVFSDEEGNILYGSGDLNYEHLFLGNNYYFDASGFLKGLPHHPKFSFDKNSNQDILQGNNVPIIITAGFFNENDNRINAKYKGQFNENRESDLFATDVIMKHNGNQFFSGSFRDFQNIDLPENGEVEITLTNENTRIGEIIGKNTTQITYDASTKDAPPTLQMLQFRNSNNQVTSTFNSSEEGYIRIAAGDFQYQANDFFGHFDYVEGSTVELYYSKYGEEEWSELEVTKYEEFFQMPAFGDYYEGSLTNVTVDEQNSWFDVKVICTDANGNKQEQIISPAFNIEETNMSINEVMSSSLLVYPNPFTHELNIQIPEAIKGNYIFKVTDLNGKIVYTQNQNTKSFVWNGAFLPKGIYIVSIQENGKIISEKVIKK